MNLLSKEVKYGLIPIFFELTNRIKGNEQGKTMEGRERANYLYSNSLISLLTVSTARRVSKGNVCSREGTERSTRSHDGMVESSTSKRTRTEIGRRHNDSNELILLEQRKVTSRGEWMDTR
jgi:hypothetical protein